MINVIQTLKNLNKEFPRFQLETLLKIVECIQEDYQTYKTYEDPWWSKSVTYKNYPVTCTLNCTSSCTSASTRPQAFVYNTTTKNHAADKTSSHQTITSTGEPATDEDMNFSSIIHDMSELQNLIEAAYRDNTNK